MDEVRQGCSHRLCVLPYLGFAEPALAIASIAPSCEYGMEIPV